MFPWPFGGILLHGGIHGGGDLFPSWWQGSREKTGNVRVPISPLKASRVLPLSQQMWGTNLQDPNHSMKKDSSNNTWHVLSTHNIPGSIHLIPATTLWRRKCYHPCA
jgi:hypothetical protein